MNWPGMVEAGNIDLYGQPEVRNPDGSISTVDSSSYNFDGVEVLLSSVTQDGRHLRTADEVIAEYQRTGRHLGKFSDPDSATRYAIQLHEDYARGRYKSNARPIASHPALPAGNDPRVMDAIRKISKGFTR